MKRNINNMRIHNSCGFLCRTNATHKLLVLLCLLAVGCNALAEKYVFVYNNGNYLRNNNGTIANSTNFVPNTCIWTCYNGNNEATLGNTSYSLKNGNRYLNCSTNNGDSPTTSTSAINNWRLNNNYLYYRTGGGTAYYLYYRGGSWRTSSTTGSDNDDYATGTNYGATNYRATVYTVTTGSLPAGYTDFTINSGDEYITATGTKTYTHTNIYNQTACSTYTFNGTTYYSTNPANAASTTNPQTEVTTGYTWSLSGANGHATVNNNGQITVTSIPDEDVVMTLTCTHATSGKSATKTVTLTNASSVRTDRYVITYNNQYFLGGTSANRITSFDPTTSLWSVDNGNLWSNTGNGYLRNNNNTVITDRTDRRGAWTLGGTESETTGQTLTNSGYLLTYNSNAWSRTNNNSGTTSVVFSVAELTYDEVDNTTAPTISAALNSTNSGIQFSHTDVSGTYSPDYTDYVFYNNTHHYWYNNASHTTAPSAVDFSTTDATYTWSITSGGNYASIDATTGLLTSKGAATTQQTVTVTLTTTEASSGYSNTKTYSVQILDHAATTVTAGIGDHNIINAVNGTLTLRGSLSGTYTAAYTTYTFNSVSHNLYNGIDYGYNTPTINDANTCTYTWSLSGEGASHSSLSSTTGQTPTLTYISDAGHDAIVNADLTVTHPDFPEFSATAEPFPIILYSTTITAPTIDFTVESNTVTLSVPSEGTTYYTTDGTDPKTSSTRQTYDPSNPIVLTSSPTTVKAYSERWGTLSAVSDSTITLKLGTPEISFDDDGTATITLTGAPSGTEFRYTTDGSDPTSTSVQYNSSSKPKVENGTTVKVIAIKEYYHSSDIASAKFVIESGVRDGVVILNDYEDHTWSYYAGAEIGNYNTNYPGKMYSPNPRNVKITYYGKGRVAKTDNVNGEYVDISSSDSYTVQVGIDAPANTFVYYKTLERDANNYFPYTTIPNPFSVRPVYGTNTTSKWRGFYKWRVKSVTNGNIYATSGGATALGAGSYLDADVEYFFRPSDYASTNVVNQTSMEVELEAVWVRAYVNTTNSTDNFVSKANGGWERNFVVYTSGTGNTATGNGDYPITYSALYPNGCTSNSGTTIATAIPDVSVATNAKLVGDVKLENIKMNGGATLNTDAHNLWVVRGVVGTGTNGSCAGTVKGLNENKTNAISYKITLETGSYGTFSLTDNNTTARTFSGKVSCKAVFGCDYDRATSNNNSLHIAPSGEVWGGGSNASHVFSSSDNRNNLTFDWLIKSGKIQENVSISDAASTRSIYLATSIQNDNGSKYIGKRRLIMEGGELASIAGGINCYNTTTDRYTQYEVNDGSWSVYIRIKHGTIRGSIYGAAAFAGANGDRYILLTGGDIKGWVAGGANGTQETGGMLYGATYVYVGGDVNVNSENNNSVINRAIGGTVFGAGCGYSTSSTSGQVSNGTNVVLADNAYVERGIYGGGSYGFTESTANVYILGGHLGGKNGGVNGTSYNANIHGGAYGGACQNNGGVTNIFMTKGLIEGGIYGGSNSSGDLSGNVTMKIDGGQVGTSTTPANVHGGGYGSATRVLGSVNLTVGKTDATAGATIYGDVYGGSAEGRTNGNNSRTSGAVTNVTLNAGTINGSLYGGGLGTSTNAADVYGPVQVTVNGGSVRTTDGTGANGSGGVYGCNNLNGEPQDSVHVDIYGTDAAPEEGQYALYAVYGGGNQANYSKGTPHVTVHNCDNSIEYVYGGGNAAHITHTTKGSTDVTIYGGNVIGNVFGGGNGTVTAANVAKNTNVKIYGGTILNVFGGSNSQGTIGGNTNVTVKSQAEGTGTACAMDVSNLFAGGNKAASKGGTLNIYCGAELGDVYGGANQADIYEDIELNIYGGNIYRVFGGNNTSGEIGGTITVNIEVDGDCDDVIGYVYGGGNQASYTAPESDKNSPKVNVKKGHVLYDVYGGGLGLSTDATKGTITGNPQVKIYSGKTDGNDNVKIDGNVFGGGNAGAVEGNTNVQVGVTP